MTRLFTDGAEMGDMLAWDVVSIATVGTSSPTPRTGTYCYKYSANNNTTSKSFTAMSEIYARFGFIIDILSSSARIPLFNKGTTELASIRLNTTSGFLEAWTSSLLATGTIVISPNTWYLIEVYYKIDDSGGRFIVKVDGNVAIDYTGDTKPGSDTTFDSMKLVGANGSVMGIDDVAINDTSGASDNSWCGDGHIISLAPTSDNTTGWVASSGSNHYALVDEVPPVSTDYIWVSGSSTTKYDKFGCADYVLSGTSITSVWVETRAKKESADDGHLRLGVRPPDTLSDSMSTGSALTTSYTRIVGNRLVDNPYTGLTWTEDEVTGTLLDLLPGLIT